MSELPEDLKYAKTHEWARLEGDGRLRVGITDHAQDALGDLVYVELPELGRKLAAGAECAVVESVKTASDIFSPVSGEIVEVNEALRESPERVNQDPYGEGWLFCLSVADPAELGRLLSASAYATEIAAES